MKVSVIIPTYNGAHRIANVLQSLEVQTFKDFETIVVVDGSTDNTLEVLEQLKSLFLSFKVVVQENKGRAAVRNRGAKESVADLLIFVDDDMRLEPDCVQCHVAHHTFGSKLSSIAVGRVYEDQNRCVTDFHFYKAYLSEKWVRPFVNLKEPLPDDKTFLTAGNLSLPKKIFDELQGFDERLTDAEDFEFAIRAKAAGISIYYLHQAITWHDDLFTLERYLKRQKEYLAANQMLLNFNPAYKKQTINHSLFKRTILRLFKIPLWIRIVDKHNFLKMLPKAFRYKIYDLVVYAHIV